MSELTIGLEHRPFLIRFARYRFDIGFGLICRLITLCINTGIILRLPKVFFDVNASQVGSNFMDSSASRNECLTMVTE